MDNKNLVIMNDTYMQITKPLKYTNINLKFSYTKKNIGQELKYSQPGYGNTWCINDNIPAEIVNRIGKRNTITLQEFIDNIKKD